MRESPKIDNLLKVIRMYATSGNFLDTRHATDRQGERLITRPEILYVLRHGWHEKGKDKYDGQYNAWNYAVRGMTVDSRKLRVVVSFDRDCLLIITAMDLDK